MARSPVNVIAATSQDVNQRDVEQCQSSCSLPLARAGAAPSSRISNARDSHSESRPNDSDAPLGCAGEKCGTPFLACLLVGVHDERIRVLHACRTYKDSPHARHGSASTFNRSYRTFKLTFRHPLTSAMCKRRGGCHLTFTLVFGRCVSFFLLSAGQSSSIPQCQFSAHYVADRLHVAVKALIRDALTIDQAELST